MTEFPTDPAPVPIVREDDAVLPGPVQPAAPTVIDRPPPEARSARWIAAILVLIAVFAIGVVVGQSGALGGLATTTTGPVAQATGTPPPPPVSSAPGTTPAATGAPATNPPGVPTSQPSYAPGDFGVFWQALDTIRKNFVGRDQLNDRDLTYGAIRGMVEALGDTGHSIFLTPEALASESQTLNGTVFGVGALLGEKGGKPIVVSVISGGPASRAGLRSGDEILTVDGTDVTSLAPDEVATRIRGEAGTTVVVKVARPSTGEELEFTMIREEINFPAASWAFVPGTHIADLRLIQFSTGAADELRKARDDAVAQGATGLILDLRSNPGGYVSEAVRVASEFIGGRVIYIRELADHSRIPVGACYPADNPGRTDDCRDQDSGPPTDLPIVVLIDQGTASSAEIVSGALASAKRGELVGQTTFGTGTVLLTFELADHSAVRLAVERWLTPDGELIFGQGIKPTVELEMPSTARALEPQEIAALTPAAVGTMEDAQMLKALDILRAAGVQ
jgi:carboxyl-terminal processing protease